MAIRWNENLTNELRRLAAKNLTAEEIGRRMHISPNTIANRAAQLRIQTGVGRRWEDARETARRLKALRRRQQLCRQFHHSAAELRAIAAAAQIPVTTCRPGVDLGWRPRWFVGEYVFHGGRHT